MYPGATVRENADLTAGINPRVQLANLLSKKRYSLPLYDQPVAPLRLKVRTLRAEANETMFFCCATWSPTVVYLAILQTAHYQLLLRCIGLRRKPRDG